MREANTALLDILVDNSVIIAAIGDGALGKKAFYSTLAELEARMSRHCRFCCFLPHTYP